VATTGHKSEEEAYMQPDEIAEVLNRPISQELLARDLTRLAYVAKDGTPRSIPIAFTWNGAEIVIAAGRVGGRDPFALQRHGPDHRDPDLGEND
jgi:hypothetical protein